MSYHEVPVGQTSDKVPRKHVIHAIHYDKAWASGDAPTECECGWEGRADDYPLHRKDAGEPHKVFSAVRARAGDGR